MTVAVDLRAPERPMESEAGCCVLCAGYMGSRPVPKSAQSPGPAGSLNSVLHSTCRSGCAVPLEPPPGGGQQLPASAHARIRERAYTNWTSPPA